MGLRDIEATLPPGFRFYPSDEELVCHYLFKKVANEEILKGTLVDIDLRTCEPWQLPGTPSLLLLLLLPCFRVALESFVYFLHSFSMVLLSYFSLNGFFWFSGFTFFG